MGRFLYNSTEDIQLKTVCSVYNYFSDALVYIEDKIDLGIYLEKGLHAGILITDESLADSLKDKCKFIYYESSLDSVIRNNSKTLYHLQKDFLNVHIFPKVKIYSENVEIGEGSQIHPQVLIYPNTKIGKNVRILAGSIIGISQPNHIGGVIIEDNVEIDALSVIEAGLKEPTIIGVGGIVDNLVYVASSSNIGKANIICSQSGIDSDVSTGNYVVMGARTIIRSNLNIGNMTQISSGSFLVNDWGDNQKIGGDPATTLNVWQRNQIKIKNIFKEDL